MRRLGSKSRDRLPGGLECSSSMSLMVEAILCVGNDLEFMVLNFVKMFIVDVWGSIFVEGAPRHLDQMITLRS